MIYLDNAATTKPNEEVIKEMKPYMSILWHNPSSLYRPSKTIKSEIERARKIIADFIGAKSEEIVFTSGGSESNCTAIQGFINYWKSRGYKSTIITTVIEHKSIIDCVDSVAENFIYVGVDNEGFVDLESIETALKSTSNKTLVSIQFANNEIGTIQNIKAISDLVHKYGAVFHTDAVQAFGHLSIDVNELGIDMLSASGHKIGMTKGIGILYKKDDININPIIYGSQEMGIRGGTENVPYIMGLAKAVQIASDNMIEKEIQIMLLRNLFIHKLKEQLGCTINGSLENRLVNNISITFTQDITGEALIYMMDISAIYLSSGSACNSYSLKPSHVLQAIGLSEKDIHRTVRISIDENLTEQNIDEVISEMKKNIALIQLNS